MGAIGTFLCPVGGTVDALRLERSAYRRGGSSPSQGTLQLYDLEGASMANNEKKSLALGMSISTARVRLERDILYMLAVSQGHKCYRCGTDMPRDNFSVEHKEPWLNAEDPKATFFDLNNIAFSHHTCNSAAASRPTKKFEDDKARYKNRHSRLYSPVKRRERYLRLGT